MDPLLSFLFLELRFLSLAVSFRRIFFDSLVSIPRENFDREKENEAQGWAVSKTIRQWGVYERSVKGRRVGAVASNSYEKNDPPPREKD